MKFADNCGKFPQTMHRVWYIPEVRLIILGGLEAPGRSSKQRRRDALNAGLTCKTLLEEALDVLWKDVENFEDLFRLWVGTGVANSTAADFLTFLTFRNAKIPTYRFTRYPKVTHVSRRS